MNWLVFAACTAITFELAIYVFRYWEQEQMDSKRVCLRIGMQAVESDKYQELFTGMSGLFGTPSRTSLGGSHALSLDVICADGGDVQWLLTFPEFLRRSVENCVYSVMENAELEDVVIHNREWHNALDLVPSRRRTTDGVDDTIVEPEIAIARIINAFTNARPGEAVILQTSLQPRGLEASFRFAARLATSAVNQDGTPNLKRANDLMRDVLAAYRALQVLDYEEIPRPLISKVSNRSTPLVWPGQISPQALVLLTAMPIGEPYASGRIGYARRGRFLPAASIPKTDKKVDSDNKTLRLLGVTKHRNVEHAIGISHEDRKRHSVMIAPSGYGKTNAQINMAVRDVHDGFGMLVYDPKSHEGNQSLVDTIADCIPPSRIKDTLWYDPSSPDWSIGLNLLEGDNADKVVGDLMPAFEMALDFHKTPRAKPLLRGALKALCLTGYTLCEVPLLLGSTPYAKKFRTEIIKQLDDPMLIQQLETFHGRKDEGQLERLGPIIDRFDPLLSYSGLRASLGQRKSGFDIHRLVADKKILLVPLAPGHHGREMADLISMLVTSMVWQTIQSTTADEHELFCMYVDEFGKVLKLDTSDFGAMLDKARSRSVSLNLATQNIFDAEIPSNIRSKILTNVQTKLAFRQADPDNARDLAKYFGGSVTAEHLQELRQFEILTRVPVKDELSDPVTFSPPFPPPPSTKSFEAVLENSRQFARPVAEAEAELFERHGLTKRQRDERKEADKRKPPVDGAA